MLALAARGRAAAPGHATSPATASDHFASAASNSCGNPPPRYAWAADVTTGGQLRWQTSLPARGADGSFAATPPPAVLVGSAAVFGQDGAVYGLRLADGHKLWSWAGGQEPRPADRPGRRHRPGLLDRETARWRPLREPGRHR